MSADGERRAMLRAVESSLDALATIAIGPFEAALAQACSGQEDPA